MSRLLERCTLGPLEALAMGFRASLALLLSLCACATSAPSRSDSVPSDLRLANLERAAQLPWTDDGRCVVREASRPWPVLVERCFQVLDRDRIRPEDPARRCAVAQAGEALAIGVCLVTAPEVVAGVVIVIGVVVVAVAIQEALDSYEPKRPAETTPATKPIPQEPVAKRWPDPNPLGPDPLPPWPRDTPDRRPKCEAIPVPHRGGDWAHDECADAVPPNRYPGRDVLVDGKLFDALQVGAPVLWEIKTDQFDTYSDVLRTLVIPKQAKEMRGEHDIAAACGYDFIVGVSSAAHKVALEKADPQLRIIATGCPR